MEQIELPYGFDPRPYQRGIFEAYDKGIKRMVLVLHRRAGKDLTCWNLMIRAAMQRVGTFYYMLPTFTQARKVIFDGIIGDGRRFIDFIPPQLVAGKINETLMRIRLVNGSTIQLVGSDQIDRLMGTNPIGVVFSEYSLSDPRSWDFIRPILRENGGFALFQGTPRGRINCLHDMLDMAKQNPGWYHQVSGVDNTGALTPEDIQEEREAGMSEELIQQEFYCSFDGGMDSAIYADHVQRMRENDQITKVPFNPAIPVYTGWDIGLDTTSIVFIQTPQGGAVNIIDYYEAKNVDLSHYVNVLNQKGSQLGYNYKYMVFPWDVRRREWDDGRSREQTAKKLGLNVRVAQQMPIEDGINAVANMLSTTYIDSVRCDRLIQALVSYQRQASKRPGEVLPKPLHNWASHPCDALRTFAVGRRGYHVDERPADRYAKARFKQSKSRRRAHSWMGA